MGGPPGGVQVRLPNGTEINGTGLVYMNYDWIAFANAWQGGKVVFQVYEPRSAMYDCVFSQWLSFKESQAYERFVEWAVEE